MGHRECLASHSSQRRDELGTDFGYSKVRVRGGTNPMKLVPQLRRQND